MESGEPVGLVSIQECARLLRKRGDRISRSGLSRYLTRHAAELPTTKNGREQLVNFEDVLAHRRRYDREVMGGAPIRAASRSAPMSPPAPPGRPSPSADPEARADDFDAEPDGAAGEGAGRSHDPGWRKKLADARRAELDLDERMGALVPVEDVDGAVADLVSSLRDALRSPAADLADAIIAKAEVDPAHRRTIKGLLDDYARCVMTTMHEQAVEAVQGPEESRAAARERWDILAETARRLREGEPLIVPATTLETVTA